MILALPGFALSSVTCGVSATGIVAGEGVVLTPVVGIGIPTVAPALGNAVYTLYVLPGVRNGPVIFAPLFKTSLPGITATTFPLLSVTT